MDAMVGISGSPKIRVNQARQLTLIDRPNLSLATQQPELSFTSNQLGFYCLIGHPKWLQTALTQPSAQQQFSHQFIQSPQQALNQLNGRFALVYSDTKQSIVASDPFASQCIYYTQVEQQLIFATSMNMLLLQLQQAPAIDHQAIFNYLYFHMIPSPQTIFKGIYKLKPGEMLRFRDGQLTHQQYFVPQFSEDKKQSQQELQQALFTTLQEAVQRQLPESAEQVGSFLSGGLDSSTITGLLNQIKANSPSFSIGFHVEKYNELPWAELCAKHFSSPMQQLKIEADETADVIDKITAWQDEPFGNSSVVPTYFCARLAKQHGMNTLLAGDGGDELFAGNARYAKQQIFEIYQQLPTAIQKNVCDPLLQSSTLKQWRLGQKIQSYLNQAKIKLPTRLESYNFIHRLGPEHFFTPEFLAQVDVEQPEQQNQTWFDIPEPASQLNRMLWLDWKHTLADNDLRKVSSMCQLANIDVRFPMLDREVVDLSCRIPSQWKLPFGKLRHFYKQSFRTFLPHELQKKPKHGFGLPFGIWTKENQALQDLASTGINTLSGLNIFSPQLLSQVQQLHQQEHAEYYGELIWILMMLGLWLKAHQQLKLKTNKEAAA
ncbi:MULTISPECIES: asparagine synthase-related protein [unclassified Motilimonas]|uniref:asparagine synthetase B family protein n=1 Tax=unclassified Motilimonas TaxID=2643697 RepID=UPI001E41BEF2|nr:MULTISPECIES: asparagine synthase-related protein [unclassified Motilimonas]MCE0556591.1 asparagine synthase [Motilimonas sp. E26]MDO6524842.1 asparagine synthase-related protein [Motilimonas sp. 1_MG-2023]